MTVLRKSRYLQSGFEHEVNEAEVEDHLCGEVSSLGHLHNPEVRYKLYFTSIHYGLLVLTRFIYSYQLWVQ